MEVGEVTEKITVEATAELIQTEKNSVESVIEEKQIRELPLIGRDPVQRYKCGLRIPSLAEWRLGVRRATQPDVREPQRLIHSCLGNFAVAAGPPTESEQELEAELDVSGIAHRAIPHSEARAGDIGIEG